MSLQKFSKTVIRTAVFPYNLIQSIFDGENKDWVSKSLKDDYILSALSLASPDLLSELLRVEKEGANEETYTKLKRSLLKYVTRMSSRCTPFGLFSGVGVLPISEDQENTHIKINEKETHKRHFRLNTNLIVQLVNKVVKLPAIIETAQFYTNTSLYELGDKLRVVSYTIFNKKRSYDLMSVETNDYLNYILECAKTGVSKKELLNWLVQEGIEVEEANEYLMELINSQILVSQLEPSMVGLEVEFQLLEGLTKLYQKAEQIHQPKIKEVIDYLEGVISRLDGLNNGGLVFGAYEELIRFIQDNLPVEMEGLDSKFLIQCNLALDFDESSTISPEQERLVMKAMRISNHFQEKKSNELGGALGEFKIAFQERYEEKFIPLVEALDVEVGIGYGARKNKESVDTDTLLDEIPLKMEEDGKDSFNWDKRVLSFWYPKFTAANKQKIFAVEITNEDLKKFEEVPVAYSATLIAKVGLYKSKENKKDVLFFEAYAGGSASNWYGRFCNSNPKLAALNQEIIDAEEIENEDVIVAEVNHLPESSLGNIIHRAQKRGAQINYLSHYNSGAKEEIAIGDLMIGIKNGRLILVSKKDKKEIRTYHSNAFNTGMLGNLPIFQFLADLTAQDNECMGSLNFSPLHSLFKFIPRITYQNIIFQRASWDFQEGDFQEILKAKSKESQIELFQAFREKWLLPKQFVIADSDNELLIDAENEDSRQILFTEIKKDGKIKLAEFLLFEHDSAIEDAVGNQYTNEVLFNFKMNALASPVISEDFKEMTPSVVDEFPPGSEWMYYKIYLGIKSADKLLLQMQPMLDELMDQGVIKKWFFIRYSDPKLHLRIRLHLSDLQFLGGVMLHVSQFLDGFKAENPIGKISMETYQRELDRYGYELSPVFEAVFHQDSRMNIALMRHGAEHGDSNDLWLPTLYSMHTYCDLFELDSDQKDLFLDRVINSFKNEFNAYSGTTKAFGKKYKEGKERIHQVFLEGNTDAFNSFVQIVEERNQQIEPFVKQIIKAYPDIDKRISFLSSVIHMSVNRQFRSRQRMYEFLMFDFLKRISTTLKYIKVKNRA